MRVTDERELEMKKGLSEKLHVSETTSASVGHLWPHVARGIQLLQCRLSTSFPICVVKQLEIWLDFLYVRVHLKHGIVPLVVCDMMCTRIPNTFTLPLENRQLAQWNFFYYVVPRRMSIHIVGAWEILAWEVCKLFTCECFRNTTLNPCLVAQYNYKFFQFSFLTIHPPELRRSSNLSFPR
jgi:hypothetical protein